MAQAGVQRVRDAAAAADFHPRAQAPEHGPADVVVKAVVDERVGTAVGEGKGAAHLHAHLGHHVRKTVGQLPQSQQDGHELEEVEGHPGDDKSSHYDEDDLDGFSQFLVVFPGPLVMHAEPPGDGAVKGQDAQQREEESQDQHHQRHDLFGFCHGFVCAVRLAVALLQFPGQQGRDPQAAGQQPDADAEAGGIGSGPDPSGDSGVHDGKVAVRTHASEEEDAAVHVDGDDKRTGFTEERSYPPAPIRHLLVHPEGQRDEEDEVRSGEVDDEDVDQPLDPALEDQGRYQDGVADDAHQEHDGVQDGEESSHVLQMLVLAVVLVEVVVVVQSDHSHRRQLAEVHFWPDRPHPGAEEGSEFPLPFPSRPALKTCSQ